MCADLSQHVARVDVPEFEKAPTTATQQTVAPRHEGQATDPVLVGVVDRLETQRRRGMKEGGEKQGQQTYRTLGHSFMQRHLDGCG